MKLDWLDKVAITSLVSMVLLPCVFVFTFVTGVLSDSMGIQRQIVVDEYHVTFFHKSLDNEFIDLYIEILRNDGFLARELFAYSNQSMCSDLEIRKEHSRIYFMCINKQNTTYEEYTVYIDTEREVLYNGTNLGKKMEIALKDLEYRQRFDEY